MTPADNNTGVSIIPAPKPAGAGAGLAILEAGGFLALNHQPDEILEIVQTNLGDQQLTPFDLPRVKIPAGGATTWEWDTLAGPVSTKELQGIVVHFKAARAYWPGEFQGSQPPACSSVDGKIGIGDPGGECASCPCAQFGSDARERGQACKQVEQWFLLTDGLLPVLLTLPPTSLKAARSYRLALATGMVKLPNVLTSITLRTETNPDSVKYSIAVPKLVARLDPAEAAAASEYAAMLAPIIAAATVLEGDVIDGVVQVPDTAPPSAPGRAAHSTPAQEILT